MNNILEGFVEYCVDSVIRRNNKKTKIWLKKKLVITEKVTAQATAKKKSSHQNHRHKIVKCKCYQMKREMRKTKNDEKQQEARTPKSYIA